MTHAAKGQYDMGRLEFHRMKRLSRSRGWLGEGECEEAKAWCQPPGHCEKDNAKQSQPGPPRDCTGTEAGTRQAEASLQKHITEDRGSGIRRSSEAARGVFGRIMEKFFSLQFLEVLHFETEVQSTLEATNRHTHTCTHIHIHTRLLHVHSSLVHKSHLSVSTPAWWDVLLPWNVSPQWSRCEGS